MRTPSPPSCRLDLAPPLADRFLVGVAPIDYSPVLLLMPFGFHLAVDTLPSGEPQVAASGPPWLVSSFRFRARLGFLHTFHLPRPARHYPRVWIRRSSSERRRDFNPPEQRAAQRTLCPPLTSAPRSGRFSVTSVASATRSRSPGVSSTVFRAQPPDLPFASLMDTDFAVSCPLVRR